MNPILTISDYDVIFLSYDEPNADANWADLLTKIPHAQRVHGVKGSDTAHKAVANLAKTDRVIVIDADNVLHGDFLSQVIEIDNSVNLSQSVLSWPSQNIINGLQYGNGGIKCWPRQLMLDMRTHENADVADKTAQVDFCWQINYLAVDDCYSTIHNNATPRQAWRAGFREGVKMSLDRGLKVSDLSQVWLGNLKRLGIWMMVGMDVPNGIWSILGAREGCYLTNFTDWDHTKVRDFDYLNEHWTGSISFLTEEGAAHRINTLESVMRSQLELSAPFNANQSKFFKFFGFNLDRQPKTVIVK
jgi:hypothetical protein